MGFSLSDLVCLFRARLEISPFVHRDQRGPYSMRDRLVPPVLKTVYSGQKRISCSSIFVTRGSGHGGPVLHHPGGAYGAIGH